MDSLGRRFDWLHGIGGKHFFLEVALQILDLQLVAPYRVLLQLLMGVVDLVLGDTQGGGQQAGGAGAKGVVIITEYIS